MAGFYSFQMSNWIPLTCVLSFFFFLTLVFLSTGVALIVYERLQMRSVPRRVLGVTLQNSIMLCPLITAVVQSQKCLFLLPLTIIFMGVTRIQPGCWARSNTFSPAPAVAPFEGQATGYFTYWLQKNHL